MPLLVGLLDASAQRNTDGAIPMGTVGDNDVTYNGHIDLEELAAKPSAGGGIIDSIANMANSILGAGIIGMCSLS